MAEDQAFLSEQLISYRGNKRKLLGMLDQALDLVRQRCGQRKLKILDGFSGSGVCSRFFKQHASLLISNDLQPYAEVLAQCFLTNRSTVDNNRLASIVTNLEQNKSNDGPPGFIQRLYAPNDDECIKPGERVYFTRRNARILDRTCRSVLKLEPWAQPLVLGPLLAEVSIRSNTAGHFKSFLKDRTTGLGKLGGSNGSRSERMRSDIEVRLPVLSQFECEVRVEKQDINALIGELGELDVAYFDPPYDNQPYGALYWMLNLLVDYKIPYEISEVAGLPKNWIRSGYSRTNGVDELLASLISKTPAKFVMLSYSNEASIPPERIEKMLAAAGRFQCLEQRHRRLNSAFQSTKRGTRGTRHIRPQVTERLYVLEKR